jgi:hypothetical protein
VKFLVFAVDSLLKGFGAECAVVGMIGIYRCLIAVSKFLVVAFSTACFRCGFRFLKGWIDQSGFMINEKHKVLVFL